MVIGVAVLIVIGTGGYRGWLYWQDGRDDAVEEAAGFGDFDALADVFSALPFQTDGPSVVIADTVRGKGLPSIAERADRWFVDFTHEEGAALLAELHGEGPADLTSETLVVR